MKKYTPPGPLYFQNPNERALVADKKDFDISVRDVVLKGLPPTLRKGRVFRDQTKSTLMTALHCILQ